MGPDTEVYQYVQSSMAPLPTRDFCELRSWRTDLTRGACALISTSVDHPKATLLGGVRALTFASRYFIEPCGGGCTRLTHLSRADYRWANCFAYRVSKHLLLQGFCSGVLQQQSRPFNGSSCEEN